MFMRRVICPAMVAVLCQGAMVAQERMPDLVEIGGYKAHPTRILARLADSQPGLSSAAVADLRSLGLSVYRQFSLVPGGMVLQLDAPVALKADGEPDPEAQAVALLTRLELLRASGRFAYANPDWWVTRQLTEPTDAAYLDGTLWGLRNTGQLGGVVGADVITDPEGSSENAWDITTGSTNVIVAVIDSGVRYTHKDLERQMWRNPREIAGNFRDDDGNGYVDDVFGVNTITGSGNPWDDDGHGTHVAGTIGASANDNFRHVGVTWNVQIMAVKFLGQFGGFTSDAIEGINYAVRHGAKVLNNSWGGGPFEELLRDAIVSASTNDVLFVAAAGNDFQSNNDLIPAFPASYDVENIVSVAALDRKDTLAYFSNFGPRSVHLGAPGVEIFSTWNGSDTDYATIDGTSMAAPHVSGVAALIWSAFPDASMLEVKERIVRTAVPVDDIRTRTASGGRVNAYRALRATPDGILEVFIEPRDGAVVLETDALPVFVTVNDLFDVTNATVWVEIEGTGERVDFLNDGEDPDAVELDNIYSAYLDLTPFTEEPYTNVIQFTLHVTAPDKEDYSRVISYHIVEPPPNDMFATPDKIPDLGAFGPSLVVATNEFATLEFDEPVHAGVVSRSRSLWYAWSPANSGPVIVDTAGSSFDVLLAVYTGATLRTLTQVAAANVVNGKRQPYVTFNATRGTTYRIAVAGAAEDEFGIVRLRVEPGGAADAVPPVVRFTSPGNGELFTTQNIDLAGYAFDPQPSASGVTEVLFRVNNGLPIPVSGTTNWTAIARLNQGQNTLAVFGRDFAGNTSPQHAIVVYYVPQDPPNDVFGTVLSPASPFYLKDTTGSVEGNNQNARKEHLEPLHGGNEGGRSIWWSWKAPESGVLELDTEGSDFDTLLGLYTGNRVDRLTTIATNDDAFAGVRFSKISQAVLGGTEYRIAVDGYGGSFGDVVLNYAFTPTNTVRVTLLAATGGITLPAPGAFDVIAGSTLTVQAVPDPYFDFSSWQGTAAFPSENPLTVAITANTQLQPVFRPRQLTDDFETGDFSRLPWTFGGTQPWQITSATVGRGQFAARSGDIGNSASSSLFLTTEFQAGTGSFLVRVSSEQDWDFLRFYVDGVLLERWSGEQDWVRYEFPIRAGRRTLEWRYVKDTRNQAGLDAAFIDDVDLPLAVSVGADTPARLSITELFDGRFEIRILGQRGQTYQIQASGELPGQWRTIATRVATQGEIRFIDPDAPLLQKRYYRAVVK